MGINEIERANRNNIKTTIKKICIIRKERNNKISQQTKGMLRARRNMRTGTSDHNDKQNKLRKK